MRWDRRAALWVFDNVPLRGPFGRLAPWLFGYGIGAKPHKVEPNEKPPDEREA